MTSITKLSNYYLFTEERVLISKINLTNYPVHELLLLGTFSILDEIKGYTKPKEHSELSNRIRLTLISIKQCIETQDYDTVKSKLEKLYIFTTKLKTLYKDEF